MILKSNKCLIFYVSIIAFCSLNIQVLASTMEPEKLPLQDGIIISSEKDIPRLEWTAGKYLRTGRFKTAQDICRIILDYDKNSIKAKAYLAAAYKAIGDEKEFKHQSEIFKQEHPGSDELYLGLTWTYSALRELKKAENICKKGINSVSMPHRLIMELAGILLRQGKIRKAEKQYRHLLKEEHIPADIFLNTNFALCKIGLKQKKFTDVVKRTTMLTELYPSMPLPYKLMADAYIGKKEYENAVNTYKKLISVNPESEIPLQEITLIYNDRIKNKKLALSYAEKGAKQFSNNPKTMDIFGWVLYTNKKYSEALHRFTTAIRISDTNPLFYYHAGMAYQKMNNIPKAVESYNNALKLLKNQSAKRFKLNIEKRIEQCRSSLK